MIELLVIPLATTVIYMEVWAIYMMLKYENLLDVPNFPHWRRKKDDWKRATRF